MGEGHRASGQNLEDNKDALDMPKLTTAVFHLGGATRGATHHDEPEQSADQTETHRRRERLWQVEIEASLKKGAEAGYLYGEAAGGWMTPGKLLIPHHHFKDGAWNHYRILADGPRIQVWLNDAQISDLVDEKKFASHPKGFIALQVHGIGRRAGPFEVRWRKLRIRTLPTTR